MALWSYYKPGLKKLILTIEGFMPKPAEIIHCFCTYLHLFDDDYIHNFLRTVGRKTQADYNYRSKDEMNLRTKLEVRTDTNARSMKQVSRKGNKSSSSSKRSSTTQENNLKGGHHSINSFGEKVKTKAEIKPANPNDVISNSANSTFKISRVSSPIKRKSLLPEILVDRFEDIRANPTTFTQAMVNESQDQIHGMMGMDGEQNSWSPRDTSGKMVQIHGRQLSSLKDDDDDSAASEDFLTGNTLDASSALSAFHDNSYEALREVFETNYSKRLSLELLKYCYIPPKTIVVDWIPTHGPLVDLGLLESGMRVTINYRICNNTGDDILIDTTTKNFQSEDTDMKTFSKPLIPGFSRLVTVTFTIPYRKCTVLGFMEVYVINMRQKMKTVIQCPIFYCVDPLAEKSNYPTCNGRALQDLLAQRVYCGNDLRNINTRRITTNFQKKKNFDGTWDYSLKTMELTTNHTPTRTASSQRRSRGPRLPSPGKSLKELNATAHL